MKKVTEVEVQTSFQSNSESKYKSFTPTVKRQKFSISDFNNSQYYVSGLIRSPSIYTAINRQTSTTRSQTSLKASRSNEFLNRFSERKNIYCRMMKTKEKSIRADNERQEIVNRIEKNKLRKGFSRARSREVKHGCEGCQKDLETIIRIKENYRHNVKKCFLRRVEMDVTLIPHENRETVEIQDILNLMSTKTVKRMKFG